MYSTNSRRDHIHGLMLGVAVGEALGLAWRGSGPRTILGRCGREPLRYRLLPGVGLTGIHTSLMLLGAQSVACSASESKYYFETLQDRLRWFLFSMPFGLDPASFKAGLKVWLRVFKVPSGCDSLSNTPATRALFCALALHGTGSRLKKWVELGTTVTHTNPMTIDGCQVLAGLAELSVKQMENFQPLDACSKLPGFSAQPELRRHLEQLLPFMEAGRSCRAVARFFGWRRGIPPTILPTTVMSCYCFLRHSRNFQRAVETAIRLGGDTPALGAIVGGLSGAHLSIKELPKELIERLSDVAYGPSWIKGMAIRMSHWPHGPDDLHAAHAEPTAVVELTILNLIRGALLGLHRVRRLPLLLSSKKK